MQIPVLKRVDGNTFRRHFLSIDELLIVKCFKKLVLFVSATGEEYQLTSVLEEWKLLLEGFHFLEVDRGILANMEKAVLLDSDLRILHFRDGLTCTVSVRGAKLIKQQYPHILIRGQSVAAY